MFIFIEQYVLSMLFAIIPGIVHLQYNTRVVHMYTCMCPVVCTRVRTRVGFLFPTPWNSRSDLDDFEFLLRYCLLHNGTRTRVVRVRVPWVHQCIMDVTHPWSFVSKHLRELECAHVYVTRMCVLTPRSRPCKKQKVLFLKVM